MTWWNGHLSSWPLEWGGDPTANEQMLAAMVSNVGVGHPANEDGVEWRWREARSIAWTVAASHMERATAQHDPRTAIDALPFWRELYNIDDSLNDQQTRDSCVLEETRGREGADVPTLIKRLKELDVRFDVDVRDDDIETVTMVGARAFQDWDGVYPFNLPDSRTDSLLANYTTRFTLFVTFDSADYPETGDSARLALEQAYQYLDDTLPAWVDYQITTLTIGFILDQSQLDWGRFGST